MCLLWRRPYGQTMRLRTRGKDWGIGVNIALWVAQVLLALVYLAAGGMKVVRPRADLVASGRFDWMKDTSDAGVKAIGAVEVLGALGQILPELTGIAPVLTPIAAIGL